MSENHITNFLDAKPFSDLTDGEIATVESHIISCIECRSAYDSARIMSSSLRARTAEIVGPGPFFKTRVMAEIRSRQLTSEEPALIRMWKAARVLVTTMALLLVVLAGITIFTHATDIQERTASSGPNVYSPEYVVLAQGDFDDELANDQVFETIYASEDSDGQ
jgi:hypothetical protein